MSKNEKPTVSISEHVANIVFDKKEDSSISLSYNLEEQIVLFSNKVLGIKIQSVALPPNYFAEPKIDAQVIHWLNSKI